MDEKAIITKCKAAFDKLFIHCLSNGIFNAWGQRMDSTLLNEAMAAVGSATAQPKQSPCAEPRCEICKFSRSVNGAGRCLRFPPQAMFEPDPRGEGQVLYVFPKVWYTDWCGEFQLDQRAVDAIEASTKRSEA